MPEYRTPGVYIEEISSGPRPVQASSTTDTGFVGVLTLPDRFQRGNGAAEQMFLPIAEDQPLLAWNRALAFRQLTASEAEEAPPTPPSAVTAPDEKKDDKASSGRKTTRPAAKQSSSKSSAPDTLLEALVQEALPGNWQIDPPDGGDAVVMRSAEGTLLRVPVRRTMMSITIDDDGQRAWDLAFGADELQVLQLIAGHAIEQGVAHTGNLDCVSSGSRPAKVDIAAIHERMQTTAKAVNGMEGWEGWLSDFAGDLFREILLASDAKMSPTNAVLTWKTLSPDARRSWMSWLRRHPGVQRFELSLRGFFENGGKTAYLAMAVQSAGASGPPKRDFLEASFDGVSSVAMVAAPGLGLDWQRSILEYAGPRGRGDIFAVLETPRYLMTVEPHGTELSEQRWTEDGSPYEVSRLETLGTPRQTELRYRGYSADALLDRAIPRDDTGFGAAYGPWVIVDNPLSTGTHDRYVIAPPSGHIAGVIASTDLKAGGGVHKAPANEQVVGVAELVTSISDREQEALNVKGVNIIRHRPGAGIRVWGARTVAADPLWTYINVRRLFLFVERSIRDAVQWAVFLPNTDQTRADLRTTIGSFLYSIYSQGMLDGRSWDEAFSVQCNRENNPDVDVRSGLLTVDVQLRPVYPAEFVRIRFRQSPMISEVSES